MTPFFSIIIPTLVVAHLGELGYDRKMNCYHCGSEQTRKHGKTRNGKQRYWCSACGRSFREHPEASGYTEAEKGQILRAYQERSSLRGLTRMFGVSRNTVSKWLKKKP